MVGEESNNRILIWNTFPITNDQPADVVVGQPDFASANGTCDAASTTLTEGVFIYQNKLIAAERNQRRVLIWNTVPTTNYAPADIVLGQSSMTDCTAPSSSTASTLSSPRGIFVDSSGRLFVVNATGSSRILIWNTFPTIDNQPADVVVGQPDFTTTSSPISASGGFNNPDGIFVSDNRMFVSNNSNNRVLIFNSIPGTNGSAADIVLGQPDFTSNSVNQGGSTAANTLNNGGGVFLYGDKLFVGDPGNSRVLVYNNVVAIPGLSLTNTTQDKGNGITRMFGTATVSQPYTVKLVTYSVNGGQYSASVPADGFFDSTREDFHFDFDPKTNPLQDSTGQSIPGYTLQLKAINTNADIVDHLFFFSPFVAKKPLDLTITTTQYPTFDFDVNKKREFLRDNLEKYQIRTQTTGSDVWSVLVDDIPVDFATVKANIDNVLWYQYRDLATNNGEYKNTRFDAQYSQESSHISVTVKQKPLRGVYHWKVVAIDKAGHEEDSNTQTLILRGPATSFYPFSLLSISHRITAPIFYGIAPRDAVVTLSLIDDNCLENICTKTYITVANGNSRFGINIPRSEFNPAHTYQAFLTSQGDGYGEIGPIPINTQSSAISLAKLFSPLPPIPLLTTVPTQQNAKKLTCFLWWCF